MSIPVATHAIGKLICDALKLPPRTKNVDLRMHLGEVVSVTCEYYPDRASVETVVKHFALYEPRPRKFIPGAMSRFDVGHEMIMPERAPEKVLHTTTAKGVST